MTKSYKNLPEQLKGYAIFSQQKIEEYQKTLATEQEKDRPDLKATARALGGIWAVAMYETYLDTLFGHNDPDPEKCVEGHYGLIDRETLREQFNMEYTEEEFDAWVEEQQDWFIENAYLPAEPSTFPALVNWLDDFFTSELLLPDSMLNLQALEKIEAEYADYDYDEVKQGMLLHLQWIREKLVPEVMPPSWGRDDAPEAYKSVIGGGMKRVMN